MRLAGFYPVSNGIDNGVEHLREKVQQGFSLMVFPEGTRSEDNNIKRFHKGAFYLAEKLNLDIIPIVIHGYSEILPKGDFIINGGQTTIDVLGRIAPEDASFGTDYAERTKKMAAFFKLHHQMMKRNLEGPEYFKKMIVNSFAYKEQKVISDVKSDLNLHLGTYHTLNMFVPSKARIVHFGNDYGQLDILLALQEPQRKIVSFIADEGKRSAAKMNYITKKRSIDYVENAGAALQSNCDIILISDNIDLNFIEKLASNVHTIILIRTTHLKDATRVARRATS